MTGPWPKFSGEVDELLTDSLQPGTVLAERYEVLEPIESGGYATIYAGRQLTFDRPVAIKFLYVPSNPRTAAKYIESFLREVKSSGKVSHPNAITVFDYGVFQQRHPYMVLELLSGHSLAAELAQRGPMPIGHAVQLHIGALGAVAAAHKQGIVHRDLKPSNLFIHRPGERQERLFVLDFGLAFNLDEKLHRITQTGEIRGTPQYVAPEYLEEQLVLPATDVYQMGLILAEMLIGVPVVNEKSVYSCFLAHASGELDIPDWVLESEVGEMVAKATAVKPSDRYPDAQHFLDALLEAHEALRPPAPVSRPIRARTRAGAGAKTPHSHPFRSDTGGFEESGDDSVDLHTSVEEDE